MADERIFQEALSNFTYDVASGGAIRHLADSGYSVKQIMEMLDYPTPEDRVKKTVWEHFIDTGKILLKKPGTGLMQEKVSYVKETGKYGRSTFRRIVTKEEQAVEYSEMSWNDYLKYYCEKKTSISNDKPVKTYVCCSFGEIKKQNPENFQKMLDLLTSKEREFMIGLLWEQEMVYYLLDARMTDIMSTLHKAGVYEALCYVALEKRK